LARGGGLVLGIHLDGITGMAVAVSVVAAATTAVFLVSARRRWVGATKGVLRSTAGAVVMVLPLIVLRGHQVLWLLWVVLVAVTVLVTLARFGRSTAAGRRPVILH